MELGFEGRPDLTGTRRPGTTGRSHCRRWEIRCLWWPSCSFVMKKEASASPRTRADLAEALLRFQREDRTETNREAALHPL